MIAPSSTAVSMTRIDCDVVLLERADDRLGERLERAGEHDALLGIDRVLDEDERGDVLEVERPCETFRSLMS